MREAWLNTAFEQYLANQKKKMNAFKKKVDKMTMMRLIITMQKEKLTPEQGEYIDKKILNRSRFM